MSKIFEIIDTEAIEQLADILNKKDLGEISIEYEGKIVSVKSKKPLPPAPAGIPPIGVVPQMPAVSPAVSQSITNPIDSPVPETISGVAVKAPIVGTYYSKPRPDASPFVTIGSKVKKGDVLYILETMKVMNEICAESDGIVSKILVNDGDALEFGQTVMIIS
ncbi:acetyl-CoA carboxylase biotin carboxyl carrier protein [Ruminococcus sp. YE71]|uniref:acetyl-CoA carboxylase biotin carboxyl carrier protein n=1 Tax=unclassified Ruminococcus TaxID=2608920 RepID=UPI00088B812C|nr:MULTISPECIES: biotin/lipoyl-containing protein [unclassified Ruminococcus]SDA17180.1 acetyl-CoA carboxylase biotin carboxyl carrier protein [Ruminococcus sp. YE78]SFW26414.1 acetyl-CoA carboxylase biotin carboxyl carrier protein [Ruminococcus sp. YE71]